MKKGRNIFIKYHRHISTFTLAALLFNISLILFNLQTNTVHASSYRDDYFKKPNVYDINALKKLNESEYPNASREGYTRVYVDEAPTRLYYADWWDECPNCGRDTYHCSFAAWGYRDDAGNEYVLISAECNHCEDNNGVNSCGQGGTMPSLDGKSGTVVPGADRNIKVRLALWLPNSYTVTFNPNNGQNNTSCTVTYDSVKSNTAAISASKKNHTLEGWYTGADGTGERVYDADGNAVAGSFWSGSGASAVWRGTENVTLYAYWKADTLTQTLYFYRDGVRDNGKTKTFEAWKDTTFKVSEHYTLSTSPFLHCHYVSVSASEWLVTGKASANVFYETDELNIRYDGNGASSGSTDGARIKYGSDITVAANGFARGGYSFAGWNKSPDGAGASYTPGTVFKSAPKSHGELLILYALWRDVEKPTVTVSPSSPADWTSSAQITITASDNCSLADNTVYQYCLTENPSNPNGTWIAYQNGKPLSIGGGLSGTFYLWVKSVTDTSGNKSSPSGYHRFGPYLFDNTPPDLSNVNSTYDLSSFDNPPTIAFDITDSHSGTENVIIRDINDVFIAELSGGQYEYRFDSDGISFYNITASDRLGNTARKMFMVKSGKASETVPSNAVWKGLKSLTLYALWHPITYTVKFDKNDSDSGSAAEGHMDDQGFTFDMPSKLPKNAYSRDGYAFCGWRTRPDGSGEMFADEQSVVNLTSENGGTVTLYARWKDISTPKVTVTPDRTVNPSVGHDAVRSIDVTISISECGSGLSPDNRYEYGFSTSFTSPPESWEEYYSAAESDSFSVMLPELGSSMTGFYYLWVKQVKDRFGNLSTDDNALGIINSCHVYGIYAFDNTAPSGSVKYIENNETLGLYNDSITESPYAVMTISDADDDIAGISGFTLVISDADNAENTTSFDFAENGGHYICRFNLYDCLPDFENIERVNMYIEADDLLGNTAAIPITSYDFGTRQSGIPIRADDIGFAPLSGALPNHYARDAFRVEAYVENISHNAHGTSFMGGHKGRLRIYTFGNVHAVSADFGSVKKYINPAYDTHPNLERTVINPTQTAYIFLHDFFVPLGCASSTYTDTTAFGFKKNGIQSRNVIYDVSGTLTDNIKTILKYNAE